MDISYRNLEISKNFAQKNNLSLCTDNTDVWTASTFFLNSEIVRDSVYNGEQYLEKSEAVLAPVFINEIYPTNLLSIPASKILEFREKRKDEREMFHNEIDNFVNQLAAASDPQILEQIMNDEKAKVEYALTEYKKSMDIMKVVKWGGYITSLVTLSTDVLGYTAFNSNVIQGLTTAGIGIGLLTGLIENKFKPVSTAYSYLSSINSLSAEYFNDFNNNLYRKMEEFIND